VVGAVAAEQPVAAQGGGDHVGGAQRPSGGDVADVALGGQAPPKRAGQAATAGLSTGVTSRTKLGPPPWKVSRSMTAALVD
jgi:hypothetical protein